MLLTNVQRKESTLFYVVIFLVIYEDLFRKFIPGHTPAFFLLKDMFLILLYGLFFIEISNKRKILLNSPIFIPLLLLFIYELLSLLWMHHFNILIFINGLKIDFFYVPLIFIAPYFFLDNRNINKLLGIVYYSLLIIFALQLFQIIFPEITKLLSLYTLSEDYGSISHSGHSFSGGNFIEYHKTYFFSSGKFGDMVFHLYTLFLILSLYMNDVKLNKITVVTMIVFFMLLMSGKRIFIILFPIFIFIFLFTLYKYNKKIKLFSMELFYRLRKLKIFFSFSIFIVICSLFILYFANETMGILVDFIFEAMGSGLVERFFESDKLYGAAFIELLNSDFLWFGQGVGTNTQGASTFISNSQDLYIGFEMGYFKFINEHGLFGFFFLVLLITSFAWMCVQSIKKNNDMNLKIISILIFSYYFIMFLRYANGHQFFGSSQTVFWFWLIVGFNIFLLKKGRLYVKSS